MNISLHAFYIQQDVLKRNISVRDSVTVIIVSKSSMYTVSNIIVMSGRDPELVSRLLNSILTL